MHQKNLIFIPFAFDREKSTGVNISASKAMDIYGKNLCVALITAKHYNPDCDVALVTNMTPSAEIGELLERHNILVLQYEFDQFVFENTYPWNLAFYKLCALKKVVTELDYEKVAYFDADVVFQSSLCHIWEETEEAILLYDIDHGLGVKDYEDFSKEVMDFQPDARYITHYGGEFFAAARADALEFVRICEAIHREMLETEFRTSKGDEFILSLAAHSMKSRVKNGGAYIYRFWTGVFRLVSTCYRFNEVAVLHLPAEKSDGLIKLFKKYIQKGKVPAKETVHKICHLNRMALRTKLRAIKMSLINR